MALTRAMAAKLASQSSVVDRDITSSQPKTSPRHRYPSSSSSSSSSSTSSSSSSASSSSSFSPPLTPTTLVNDSPPSISLVSLFNNFVDNVSQKFHDISQKIEHISNRMSNIEESIGDQHFIINELERELAIVADRLNKISPKRSDNTSSSSVKITLHKGTQTNDNNISLTSSPHIDSLSTSNPQSLPQSSLAFHSIDLHCPAPKSTFSARPATYWRSTPSCPTPPRTPTPTRAEDPRSVAPNPRPRNRTPPTPIRSTRARNSSSHTQHLRLNTRASSTYSYTITERPASASAYRDKPSLLVLGDSNTKYVKLSGAYNIVREPTFLIQDINPSRCKGFSRVWIHCGINNLKYNRCSSYSGVKDIFKLFMSKLGAIRNMYPDIKLYVSPILPCAIPGLNDRAGWFNSLLFSVKHIWWNELKINGFCCRETGMFAQQFRSFRNRGDKIHLGMHSIKALECALLSELNKVNGRLYSSVVYNH